MSLRPPLKTWPMVLLAALALPANANEASFSDCYARWEKDRITVGNKHFERSWNATEQGLSPTTFQTKDPDFEWLAAGGNKRAKPASLSVKTSSTRPRILPKVLMQSVP